jgi:hypothetical protein
MGRGDWIRTSDQNVFERRGLLPEGRPASLAGTRAALAPPAEWSARQVEEIGRTECKELLERIEAENGTVRANRVMQTLRALYNWQFGKADASKTRPRSCAARSAKYREPESMPRFLVREHLIEVSLLPLILAGVSGQPMPMDGRHSNRPSIALTLQPQVAADRHDAGQRVPPG